MTSINPNAPSPPPEPPSTTEDASPTAPEPPPMRPGFQVDGWEPPPGSGGLLPENHVPPLQGSLPGTPDPIYNPNHVTPAQHIEGGFGDLIEIPGNLLNNKFGEALGNLGSGVTGILQGIGELVTGDPEEGEAETIDASGPTS